MKSIHRTLAIALAASTLAACGGGGGTNGDKVIPPTTTSNLSSLKAGFAVGTANIGADATVGLNFVATLRQTNGLSGVLADTPTITGPFTVPANTAGAYGATNVDAGKGQISGSPQVSVGGTPVNTTLGTFTGVFSYGLAPLNSDNSGNTAYYPGNPNASPGNGFAYSSAYDPNGNLPFWPLPLNSANGTVLLGGPPAYPFFNDGTYPPAFAGYSPGFFTFEAPPVSGNYTLSIAVTPSNAAPQTFTANSTLNAAKVLGLPTVAFASDGAGGGTGTLTVSDANVTESLVFVQDTTSGLFFTIGPLKGTGSFPLTLPDKLGVCSGTNCQTSSSAKPSMAAGDTFTYTAVSFDYPAFEWSPPGNTSQNPIPAGTQADLSESAPQNGTE